MRPIYIFLAGVIVILSSCSSMNNVRQTPDDVYYSPGPSKSAHVSSRNGSSDNSRDEYYSTAPSDQYVRMKTVDQARWSTFDDYNYYDSYYAPRVSGYYGSSYYGSGYYGSGYYGSGYSPYAYGFSGASVGMGYWNPWNPYYGWNNYFTWNTCYNPYFYNPYYGSSVVIVNPKISGPSPYTQVRAFNPGSYHPANYSNGNNDNGRFYRPGSVRSSYYNNNNPSSGSGSRFNNSNSPYNNGGYYRQANSEPMPSYSQPVRSYSPSPSPSSGSGGGGGGGGISRPGRN